jgi:hypothetical protein
MSVDIANPGVETVPLMNALRPLTIPGFIANIATTFPNNVTNASVFAATDGTADQDIVLALKGNGAFQLFLADNGIGGNKRGAGACDFSTRASNAFPQYVASGAQSFACGLYVMASGQQATGFGFNIQATGAQAFAAGNALTATGPNDTCFGISNNATGGVSFSAGYGCNSDGQFSSAWGRAAVCRGRYGSFAHSSFETPNQGNSQRAIMVLHAQTTNATPVVAVADNTAASAANQCSLPPNSTYVVRGTIVARRGSNGDSSAWSFQGVIKQGAAAANTAVVGSISQSLIAQDAGAGTWSVSLTADTTNGALAVTVTGQVSATINWFVKVESEELVF